MSRIDEEIAANSLDEVRIERLRNTLAEGGDLAPHRETIMGLLGCWLGEERLRELRYLIEEAEDEVEDLDGDE